MSDEWELVPDDGQSDWELVPDESSPSPSFSDYASSAFRGLQSAPYELGLGFTGAIAAARDQFRDQNQTYEPDFIDIANKYGRRGIDDQILGDVKPETRGVANFSSGLGKIAGQLATGPLTLPMMVTDAIGNRYNEARNEGADRGDATRSAALQGVGTGIGAKIALPFIKGGGGFLPQGLKSAASLVTASVPMTYFDYLSRTAYTGDEFSLGDVGQTVWDQAPETALTGMLLPSIHKGVNRGVDAVTSGARRLANRPAPRVETDLDLLRKAYEQDTGDVRLDPKLLEAPVEQLRLPAPEAATEAPIVETPIVPPEAPLDNRMSFERPQGPERLLMERPAMEAAPLELQTAQDILLPKNENIAADKVAEFNSRLAREVEGKSPIEAPAQLEATDVRKIPVEAIGSRPDLMQFKKIDNRESGTNTEDKISGKWDDLKAGNLLLWEPISPKEYNLPKGQKYIVANGHHRLELAKETKTSAVNAQIVREADGYSALDARRLGAEINIADGKGTIYDQAKFIRDAARMASEDGALERIDSLGTKSRKAKTVALNAEDNLFTSFINEQITPEQAEVIAKTAPNNDGLQRLGVSLALQGKSPSELRSRLEVMQVESLRSNDVQQDLFGNLLDQSAFSQAESQAKTVDSYRDAIKTQIAAASGATKNPDAAKKMGVEVLDRKNTSDQISHLREELARWDKWYAFPDLVQKVKSGAVTESPAPTSIPENRIDLESPVPLEPGTKESMQLEPGLPFGPNPEKGAVKVGEIARDIHDVAQSLFSTAAKKLDRNRGYQKLSESERFMEGRMDKQLLPREAVKQYRQLVAYPETIARKSPEFAPIYEAQQQRIRTQSEVSADLHGMLKPYWNLEKTSRAKVDRFLIEERELARKAAVEKRPVRDFQPSQLEKAGWTPEEIAARSAVKDGMRKALQYVGHALRSDAYKISDPILQQQYINDVNKFISVLKDTQYVPFSRYGKGFEVTVKDKNGDQTLYRKFFDSQAEARSDFKQQEKVFPEGKVTWGERASMRPDAYDDLPGHIVGTGREFNAEKWTEAAKLRQNEGFTKHFIRAALTPGFETNLTMSMADYVMGLSKFYSRKMAQPATDAAMSNINPDTKSEIRAYAKRYLKDLDKGTKYQNAVMNTVNFWTLAGVPMSAVTNLTQALTTTYPALQSHVGPAKAIGIWSSSLPEATGMKPISDPQLKSAIDVAIKQGVLEAQAMNELRAFRGGDPTAKTGFQERAMLPFKMAEKFNRTHAFISAWKAADSMGMKDPNQKLAFAETFVGRTQFVNNQGNLPEIARSVPGRIMLQYKTSFVGQMLRFLRSESTGTAMTSLGMLGAIGGISALPFMKEFFYTVEGLGYDPKSFVRKFFDNPRVATRMLSGIPAADLGINMSGTAGLGEIVPGIDDKAGSVVKAIAGPAGDVFINRPLKAKDLYDRGQYDLVAETIAPRMFRGPMKVARIHSKDGDLRDSKGRTSLEDVTPSEQAIIALGGTPQRLAEFNEVRDLEYRMEGYYKEKLADLNERARNARENEDWEELDKLREQLDEFNDEYGYSAKLNYKPKKERQLPKAIRRAYEEKRSRITGE